MTGARPRPLGDQTEHYWRVQRMARATGLDLVEAQQDGALDPRHWAGMVRRCRGCAWAEACGRWLDRPEVSPRPLPEGCANRRLFGTLQALAQTDA